MSSLTQHQHERSTSDCAVVVEDAVPAEEDSRVGIIEKNATVNQHQSVSMQERLIVSPSSVSLASFDEEHLLAATVTKTKKRKVKKKPESLPRAERPPPQADRDDLLEAQRAVEAMQRGERERQKRERAAGKELAEARVELEAGKEEGKKLKKRAEKLEVRGIFPMNICCCCCCYCS